MITGVEFHGNVVKEIGQLIMTILLVMIMREVVRDKRNQPSNATVWREIKKFLIRRNFLNANRDTPPDNRIWIEIEDSLSLPSLSVVSLSGSSPLGYLFSASRLSPQRPLGRSPLTFS